MAWTQADLDALDAAIQATITSGAFRVQSVQFADRSQTFYSLKEMRDLRAFIAGLVQTASGRSGTRLAATRKGT